MGGFNVRLSLVGLRHARLEQLVQRPPEGSPDEGGAPPRAGGGDAFQAGRPPPDRLVLQLEHPPGGQWCNLVYPGGMQAADKSLRQSVSLPARVARRVKALARTRKTSASRVITELIESGLEAREQQRRRFFELAERLTSSRDRDEQRQLKDDLARLTFGA